MIINDFPMMWLRHDALGSTSLNRTLIRFSSTDRDISGSAVCSRNSGSKIFDTTSVSTLIWALHQISHRTLCTSRDYVLLQLSRDNSHHFSMSTRQCSLEFRHREDMCKFGLGRHHRGKRECSHGLHHAVLAHANRMESQYRDKVEGAIGRDLPAWGLVSRVPTTVVLRDPCKVADRHLQRLYWEHISSDCS